MTPSYMPVSNPTGSFSGHHTIFFSKPIFFFNKRDTRIYKKNEKTYHLWKEQRLFYERYFHWIGN